MDLLFTLAYVAVGSGVWLWLLRRYDRIEPEGVRFLLQVGLIGGSLSVIAALVLNDGVQRALGIQADVVLEASSIDIGLLLLFCLLIGFNEEVCKAVATVYTTRRFGDLDEPVDAMIYAMTVGLGFAGIENVLYASRFGNDVLLVRFLWPVPAHMAYSALWGYGLALARFKYPDVPRWKAMAPSVAAAALIHAGANFLLFLGGTVMALASLAVLGVLAYLAHQRLHALVAESPYLAPGECPVCRTLNAAEAVQCRACEEPLQNTDLFVVCPCGLSRIPAHADVCPTCGIEVPAADPAAHLSAPSVVDPPAGAAPAR